MFKLTKSQRDIMKKLTFAPKDHHYIVHCGQMTQHLRGLREAIFGWRPQQFVVAEGHNTLKITNISNFGHLKYDVFVSENLIYIDTHSEKEVKEEVECAGFKYIY